MAVEKHFSGSVLATSVAFTWVTSTPHPGLRILQFLLETHLHHVQTVLGELLITVAGRGQMTDSFCVCGRTAWVHPVGQFTLWQRPSVSLHPLFFRSLEQFDFYVFWELFHLIPLQFSEQTHILLAKCFFLFKYPELISATCNQRKVIILFKCRCD
jgi:hypothetical protein